MTDLKCSYGATVYRVSDLDFRQSQYYGLFPTGCALELLPYYSTVDDRVIVETARQLNEQLAGRSDRTKAAVALAFVQQNTKYVSDESRFNGQDVWELPIYVLSEHQADCDGMADLFVSLAYNLGLDVVEVAVTGHMCAGVNAEGMHGVAYPFEGREYYHMETTDELPISGRFWGSAKTDRIARPAVPTEVFKSILADHW